MEKKLSDILPTHAMVRRDGVWHEIHKHYSVSVCGVKLDSNKVFIQTRTTKPETGECEACKAKKQEFLHRAFEKNQKMVQKTARVKKNTLGRKQVFNETSDKFSM